MEIDKQIHVHSYLGGMDHFTQIALDIRETLLSCSLGTRICHTRVIKRAKNTNKSCKIWATAKQGNCVLCKSLLSYESFGLGFYCRFCQWCSICIFLTSFLVRPPMQKYDNGPFVAQVSNVPATKTSRPHVNGFTRKRLPSESTRNLFLFTHLIMGQVHRKTPMISQCAAQNEIIYQHLGPPNKEYEAASLVLWTARRCCESVVEKEIRTCISIKII